jgi:hypothetical protein
VAPECDCDDASASSAKHSEPQPGGQPEEAALAETVVPYIDRGLEPAASLEEKMVRSPFEGIVPLRISQQNMECGDKAKDLTGGKTWTTNWYDYLPEDQGSSQMYGMDSKLVCAPAAQETKDPSSSSNLLDYLPETPQRDPQCTPTVDTSKQQQSGQSTRELVTATPESYAESIKRQALAQAAQESANRRKKLCVFSRTPPRKRLPEANQQAPPPGSTRMPTKVDVPGEVVEALLVEALRK